MPAIWRKEYYFLVSQQLFVALSSNFLKTTFMTATFTYTLLLAFILLGKKAFNKFNR